MLITELDQLQSIETDSTVKGGIGSLLSLVVSLSGQLSLKQGDTVLYENTIEPPKQVTLSFQGTSFLSTSVVSQSINGVSQTTVNISTDPSSLPLSSWPFNHFPRLPFYYGNP